MWDFVRFRPSSQALEIVRPTPLIPEIRKINNAGVLSQDLRQVEQVASQLERLPALHILAAGKH